MNELPVITGSLVLYDTAATLFEAAIRSFLAAAPAGRLVVVDNSPRPLRSGLFEDPRVDHVHLGRNVGFGAGHNAALAKIERSDLHVFVNPDVRFDHRTLAALATVFANEPQVVVTMPRIVYPNGELQRLCKLLPTPMDLIIRRFLPFRALRDRLDRRYELHDLSQDRMAEIPSLSGCFLVVRTEALRRVGGFDDRYFMYMEDVDLVRRLASVGKALYCPQAQVVHEYAKGSYKNRKLLSYHLRSAVLYFNKWGWFFDAQRSKRNRAALAMIAATSAEPAGSAPPP